MDLRSFEQQLQRRSSVEQELEPGFGFRRIDFEDFRGGDVFRHEWIFLHPALKICQRRVVGRDPTARLRLKAPDH